MVEPVPFYLRLPGRDSLGLDGARSEWRRVVGLLHLEDDRITIEWSTTRRIERVSLSGIRTADKATRPRLRSVPGAWIAEARVAGGWWAPRLIVRARRLDAFEGLPGAKLGTLALRIARRDRGIAAAMVAALTAQRTLGPGASIAELPAPSSAKAYDIVGSDDRDSLG